MKQYAKEALVEAAERAKLSCKKTYTGYKKTKCNEATEISVNKQSILNLINELK